MKTVKNALISAMFLSSAAVCAAAAQAGSQEFLPAAGCVATTPDGELVSSVWYQNGLAVNNHSSSDRDILCPIRYERLAPVSTSVIVRSVVHDNTNDAGGKVAVWICEADSTGNGQGCVSVQTTTDLGRGLTTLQSTFTPNDDTRFLYLRVRLPDVDGDGLKSFFTGYRVCRGFC